MDEITITTETLVAEVTSESTTGKLKEITNR